MAMDMSQEQLMEIISQLDSALLDLSSSTIPPPPPSPLLPSDPWCTVTPSAPVRLPLPPPAAAAPEQVTTAEMVYLAAAMRPVVCVDSEAAAAAAPRPRRRNVRISSQPQSVAARLRRERVSQRMRVLQRLVPGGTRMDTASMLDEAIRYVKFLKGHVHSLEKAASAAALHGRSGGGGGGGGHVAAGRQYHSSPYFV